MAPSLAVVDLMATSGIYPQRDHPIWHLVVDCVHRLQDSRVGQERLCCLRLTDDELFALRTAVPATELNLQSALTELAQRRIAERAANPMTIKTDGGANWRQERE